MRANRGAAFFIAVAIGSACGGKTALEDPSGDPGSGGSSGSASGSGGTAGSGSAARGGGGGGASGSSAGRGGTAGSASGGSAGATPDAGSIPAKIQAVCAAGRAAGCEDPGCELALMESLREVASYGCETEFFAIIDCSLENAVYCSDNTACQGAVDRAWLCYREGYYCDSFSQPPGTCSITCEEWGARCDPGPSGPRCVCTSGPRSGNEFSTSESCGSNRWPAEVRARCRRGTLD